MLVDAVASFVANPDGPLPLRTAKRVVRKGLLKVGDPLVTNTIAGRSMVLPLSHRLPRYLSLYPNYSMNVGRLAAAAAGPVIDVGANIGDTVAIIRSQVDVPVLCIEGNARYAEILRRNVGTDRDVEVAECFLGATPGTQVLEQVAKGGTLHLAPSTDSAVVSIRLLSDVLQQHPRFLDARLLKTDTDGYDAEILLSSLGFIQDTRPVLFFEYDPAFLEPVSGDGRHLLRTLHDAGYRRSVIYDNRGDVLFATEPSESRVLLDLDRHIRRRNHEFYVDIAMFHDDDSALFERFRSQEIDS